MAKEKGKRGRGASPWTQDRVDTLLDLYFDNWTWKHIATELGTAAHTGSRIIREILDGSRDYTPGASRAIRQGKAWNAREDEIIRATEARHAIGQRITLLLMRSIDEIRARYEAIKPPRPSAFANIEEAAKEQEAAIPTTPEATVEDEGEPQVVAPEPFIKRYVWNTTVVLDKDKVIVEEGRVYADEETPVKHEGAKYLRKIRCRAADGTRPAMLVDVYDVLTAFGVTSHAVGHAVKKLLCPGQRGKGDYLADLIGAQAALSRAIEDAQEDLKDAYGDS